MKKIPAGAYIRGRHKSTEKVFNYDHTYIPWEELQPHPVRITKPFYLSAREITVGEFRTFVDATGYATTAEIGDHSAVGFHYVENEHGAHHIQPFHSEAQFTWKNPGFPQSEDHPVVCVSWKDAQEYCRWLSEQQEGLTFRLPTEAEWEFACRGGNGGAFWWGNEYRGSIHERANLANVELEEAHEDLGFRHWFIDVDNDPGDGHVYTAPTGSFPANRFGLHDTHGNVWEWCQDKYVDTTYRQFERQDRQIAPEVVVDPVCEDAWNEFGDWRIIRGGSWYNSPATCRSDIRNYYEANNSACYIGFRVARDASEEECRPALEQWRLEQEATARVRKHIQNFRATGPGGVYRLASLGDNPPVEVTEGLHRISFLTAVEANRVETDAIFHLANVPGLTEFRINILDTVTDASLAAIADRTSLQRVTLPWGRSPLTNDCVQHLTGLVNLKSLEINGPAISDEGLTQLQNLKQLTSLNLSETGSKGGILSSLGSVPLKSLALADLTDEHAPRLAELPMLQSFSCRGSSLTGQGFRHLGGLTQLRSLGLRYCSSIAPSDFGPIASLKNLTSLDLAGTQAGDEAMHCLRELHQLTYLNLGDQITDDGFIGVCAAVSLETIHISSPHLTDDGLRDLWRLQRLGTLNLSSAETEFTGKGFSTFREASTLRTLMLRSDDLTDEALVHLSAMPALERLYLGTGAGGPPALTDRGLLALKDAPRLKYLELPLTNTAMTDAAVEELKESNPDLRVEVRR